VRTLADGDGNYKFKKVLPGLYTVIVAIQYIGELNRTIEIGPDFADSKGRITLNVAFNQKPDTTAKTVSAKELSIPNGAKAEYRKALDCLARNDTSGAIAHLKMIGNCFGGGARGWCK
jgi:hypothetical protein